MKYLDDAWERKEHFAFFQSRKNPCASVTFLVNAQRLFLFKDQNRFRLTDCLYFAALLAANSIDGFKQRIVNLRPVEFDTVDAAFTYIPHGRTFHCNCVSKFDLRFVAFSSNISTARALADSKPTLSPDGGDVQSLIYFSCLPYLPVLSVTNPWGDPWTDSVPRIIFGKKNASGDIPVSIEALHSFIDGVHLSAFYSSFRSILENPEKSFS
jgi:chloramphenicol O-acetyltransferase type A